MAFCRHYSIFFRVPLDVLVRTLGVRLPQVGNHYPNWTTWKADPGFFPVTRHFKQTRPKRLRLIITVSNIEAKETHKLSVQILPDFPS
jgi:hypothetical protein